MAKDLYRGKRRVKGEVQSNPVLVLIPKYKPVLVPTQEEKSLPVATDPVDPPATMNNQREQTVFSLLPRGQFFLKVTLREMTADDPFWPLLNEIVKVANEEIDRRWQ